MSLSSLLSVARSALLAHQRAMTITAGNIANSRTPGYSRQRLTLMSTPGAVSGWGSGVAVGSIDRVRDSLTDGAFRRDAAFLGTATTSRQFMTQIEAALGEPSDTGVASSLDALFRSFRELSENPSSPTSREEVRAAAERFANRLRHLGVSLSDAMSEASDRLQAEVDDVNTLTAEIADLNQRILETEQAGGGSPELRDQRDRLLDELSGHLAIDVSESPDGTVSVSSDGAALVSGTVHRELSVTQVAGGGLGVTLKPGQRALAPQAGTLKALADLTNTTLPGLLKGLDDLAREVVTSVNNVHRTGYTGTGETGVDFFRADGITAATIGLSAAVADSASAIAAGSGPGGGDNVVAKQIADLADEALDGLGGKTPADFYAAFASRVGTLTRSALNDETAYQSLTARNDMLRASVSGVSVDEEMIALIDQQEAYTAAARLVSVADELIQDLLRTVG